MIIKTRGQVNDRTADGRVYSAGEGTTSLIDDDDQGMVELMHRLAKAGQVDILDDEEPAESETEDPPAPETKQAIQQPAEPKKAVTTPRTAKTGRAE